MPINFGTDGWRAVISDTFTFHNLRLVTQAIADAIRSGHWHTKTTPISKTVTNRVVVGFDTRFLSDRYARDVARVMAANGYTVYIAQADSSTPSISYAVKNVL
jgi:phosphomannomutase